LVRWEAVNGNHFIEIQKDEGGSIWVMVHSGSRGFGKKFYDYFSDIASKLCRKWHTASSVPFFPFDSDEGKDYLEWMNLLLNFAFLNRQIMMDDVVHDILHYFPYMKNITNSVHPNFVGEKKIINIHHNYASLEHHMGKDLWIHRKGAVLARKGVVGIIPGSQSTNSFITVGLGNKMSLESSSHGSGRTMGRTEFSIQNQSKIQEIEEDMKQKGIVFSKFQKVNRGRAQGLFDISETGAAYKCVLDVMENQKDLVNPIVKLSPVINWKG
jgi:tRNA-splicing ligase RtcB